jgi:hypothetical protein
MVTSSGATARMVGWSPGGATTIRGASATPSAPLAA